MATAFLFLLLTLFIFLMFYFGTGEVKSVLVVASAWMIGISTLALLGFFENTTATPPRFLIVLFGNIALVVYCFRTLKNSTLHTPYVYAIHGMRLPIELLLYYLYVDGLIPEIMTFKGYNFDILIGISALLLLVHSLIQKPKISKQTLLIWHITGCLFLAAIVTLAVLSAPLPIQQLAFDQPNRAVLQFPYVLLPAAIVPIVFLTHALAIRQLVIGRYTDGDDHED